MDPFPEEWELLALFEKEPVILDPEIPWRYNRLTFEIQRGGDKFHCAVDLSTVSSISNGGFATSCVSISTLIG